MPLYIALLRGINVSGQKKIKMADLRELLSKEGFQEVSTYIQSGNILFEDSSDDLSLLESRIHDAIEKSYGFDVPVLVKTPADFEEVIRENPYKDDPEKESRLYLTFLNELPEADRLEALKEVSYEPEEFLVKGKNIYFYSPKGYGRAKMNNNFFEKKLKVAATTRNWKTINVLLDMSKA